MFAIAAIVTNVGAMSIKMHAQTADVPTATNSTWKTHTAFDGQISKIIEGDRYVYVFAHQAYYHVNKSWSTYNTPRATVLYIDKKDPGKGARGLFDTYESSGVGVRVMNYNPRTRSLWICYDDGSIDVFEESGTMNSIKDLKSQAKSLSGAVGTVSFDLDDDAWIALDKGYARIDGTTFEVKEWAYLDTSIESICRIGDRVVAIMDNAFYDAPENSDRTVMSSFRKHSELTFTSANRILPISAGSFATLIDGSKLSLASWNNGNMVLTPKITDANFSGQLCTDTSNITDGVKPCCRYVVANQYENNFVPVNNGYLAFSTTTAYFIPLESSGSKMEVKSYKLPMTAPRYVGSLDFHEFWFYEKRKGFYTRSTSDQGKTWSAASVMIEWQGPVSMLLSEMAYSPTQGLLVMNKYSTPVNYIPFNGFTTMLLSGYKNGKWTNYSPIYGTPRSIVGNSTLTNRFNNERSYPYPVTSPTGFILDSLHPDYVLVSSLGGGIIAMNTKDVEGTILRFSDINDPFKAFPGYVDNFPLSKEGNRYSWFKIEGTDADNVMWTCHLDALNYSGMGAGVELYYWTAEDRSEAMKTQDITKTEKWKSIFFPIPELGDPLTLRGGAGIVLKHPENKNKIAIINNNSGKGIIICDHNGTLDDFADDSAKIINKINTPEGLLTYSGWMMDVAEDPLTGNIWMGFDSKLVSVDLTKPISDGVAQGELLYVTNADGSRESTVMSDIAYCIAFDEYNRMWVGTGWSGVYGISTDRKKVFAHYDMSNSPLKSNQIDGLCWDPESKELMIGSDMGLLSVKPDKAGSTVQGIANPMAYPVNILPEYKGTVKFVNLPVQAVLSVCDGAGRQIKQLPAVDNGQTVWDVCDSDGQPVPQGVYTVRDVARQVSDFRIIVTR